MGIANTSKNWTSENFKINTTWSYTEIEKVAEKESFTLEEYGLELIGQSFVVLENDNEDIISFVYNGWNATYGAFYKVIYRS